MKAPRPDYWEPAAVVANKIQSRGARGPRGVLLSTHSDVSGLRWTYFLAVGVGTYQLRAEEAAAVQGA